MSEDCEALRKRIQELIVERNYCADLAAKYGKRLIQNRPRYERVGYYTTSHEVLEMAKRRREDIKK